MSRWRQVRAAILLPGMVTVVIPGLILYYTKAEPAWSLSNPLQLALSVTGIPAIGLGVFLWIKSNALFARVGKGTLAPWDPTSHLVVQGVYRHVRNPMISGVCAVLLGEAMLFLSLLLFIWFVLFVIGNVIYIPLMEEPGLRDRFGDEFLLYKKNVPRWVPRLKPWVPPYDKE